VVKYLQQVHHYDSLRSDPDASFWGLGAEPRLYEGGTRVLAWVSTHRADGTPCNRFRTGEGMVVRIGFENMSLRQPYFSVLIQNEYAERVATLHSTHSDSKLSLPPCGAIECRVDDLRLGEGDYRLMLDFGSYGGFRGAMTSVDCVPAAALIHVALGDYVGGIGLDAFQGAAHRSQWKVVDTQSRRT
jgi:lipopolysaccharide transport system ATP-binding protein